MSDLEDDNIFDNGSPERADDHGEPLEGSQRENEEDDAEEPRNSDNRRRDEEEEEEEEEEVPRRRRYEDDEEDDEEDEDEEEEQDADGRPKKKTKKRHKKPAVNRYLDVEAEVDTDEEEEEDDEDDMGGEFIAAPDGDGDDEDAHDRARAMRLDRQKDLNGEDLEVVAKRLVERYQPTAAAKYTGDMNEIPQRLLMPSVEDANLWQVRVKPGKERDLVFSLMRKAIDREYTVKPLQILSAFQRDSLPGMIYVEARSHQQVQQACNGLVGIYPSRGINLVPIDEMASLLQIKKKEVTVTPGSWVRIRRGKYMGDLAQVVDATENGDEVGLKFVPRIEMNPKEETADGKKRKKAGGASAPTTRPAQRFFNYEEVMKVYGRKAVSKRNQVYVFQGDTYRDGYVEKDIRITGLILDNINPTLDEITQFTRGRDGAENEHNVDLSVIAEASRKAAIAVLQPGDHVEVFEGEQTGVHGHVESIENDIVSLIAEGVDIEGQRIDVPARSVRKRFKPGDHVKVMSGQNVDESGLVVSVADNVVTFWSDMSNREVSVFSKDLRESAEVGVGTNTIGNYELHDLVSLDAQTVAVIFKTERDTFRVLDQNGHVRVVLPHQISMRRDSNRAIATDAEGHELRIKDTMKERDGEQRQGVVLHLHQSFFAFLHNRDIVENGGVFVTRARALVSLAPKNDVKLMAGQDLSKQNPAIGGGGMIGSGMTGRGPRDKLIGEQVNVVRGPHKGYVGTVKDTTGNQARVELRTGNKVITLTDKMSMLKWRDRLGELHPLDEFYAKKSGAGSFVNSSSSGSVSGWGASPSGRTPAHGRTPNAYAGSGTPAWNAGKSPYRSGGDDLFGGGKTPAWGGGGGGGRTPNPHASSGNQSAWGGRTPAWGGAGGGATPARNNNPGWGGATPGARGGWTTPAGPRGGTVASGSAWGGATPGRAFAQSGGGDYGGATPAANRAGPSEWGGATPGRALDTSSAATPGTWATPSAWPASAPTPGPVATPYEYATPGTTRDPGSLSVPTPVYSGGYGEMNSHASPDDDIGPDWLVNIPPGKRHDLIVDVKGTMMDSWNNGTLEGMRGCVMSVMAFDSAVLTKTATVKMIGGEFSDQEKIIPLQYLRPVPAKGNGDRVFMLSGRYKHNPGNVAGTSGPDVWVVEWQSQYVDVKSDHVCLMR